jgi:hypothetical protein
MTSFLLVGPRARATGVGRKELLGAPGKIFRGSSVLRRHSVDFTVARGAEYFNRGQIGRFDLKRITLGGVLPLAVAICFALGLAAPENASAHWWGNWHWNRSGSAFGIGIQNSCAYSAECDAAISDINRNLAPVWLVRRGYHTSISVYDGYFGKTGWGGLAQLTSVSGSHIVHAHSMFNRSYPPSSRLYVQGVQCQEIGHTIGLDHSNTSDCMGLGYYSYNRFYMGPHNSSDIWNFYRYH